MTGQPLDILIAHDAWATGRVLDRCRSLSLGDFHREFDIGIGSLHDTLRHNLNCMIGWCAAVRGDAWPARDEAIYAVDDFATAFAAATAEVRRLAAGDLDERLTRGDAMFTRGGMLTHLLVHGTHHRAQCLNIFRQLGDREPLRLDVIHWQRTADMFTATESR